MLALGEWRLASRGDLHLVIEVLEHAAFAYLWSSSNGIRSHVWLFNRDTNLPVGDQREDGVPPRMPADNIVNERYVVPGSINDIACEVDEERGLWFLSWEGGLNAVLHQSSGPGASVFVAESCDLALAWFERDGLPDWQALG